jgi:hypothetical protein
LSPNKAIGLREMESRVPVGEQVGDKPHPRREDRNSPARRLERDDRCRVTSELPSHAPCNRSHNFAKLITKVLALWLTCVYDPKDEGEKNEFLNEL